MGRLLMKVFFPLFAVESKLKAYTFANKALFPLGSKHYPQKLPYLLPILSKYLLELWLTDFLQLRCS